MSRDAVLCLKQLHLTLFYKISESSYVPPHQYARKTQSNAVSRYQPRFHAECSTVFRKTPLNSKPIPQFDSTNYLALISRTCSTRISCQTFSNSWVEQNCPWLLDYINGTRFKFINKFSLPESSKMADAWQISDSCSPLTSYVRK